MDLFLENILPFLASLLPTFRKGHSARSNLSGNLVSFVLLCKALLAFTCINTVWSYHERNIWNFAVEEIRVLRPPRGFYKIFEKSSCANG